MHAGALGLAKIEDTCVFVSPEFSGGSLCSVKNSSKQKRWGSRLRLLF